MAFGRAIIRGTEAGAESIDLLHRSRSSKEITSNREKIPCLAFLFVKKIGQKEYV